jgi:hypothetical protein
MDLWAKPLKNRNVRQMKTSNKKSVAAYCLLSAGLLFSESHAGESPLGPGTPPPYLQWTGTVERIYYRSTDKFAVLIKDAAGNTNWVFSKMGSQPLSVLLAQKSQKGQIRFIYTRNEQMHDQSNCIDIVYERWVCDELKFIEAM